MFLLGLIIGLITVIILAYIIIFLENRNSGKITSWLSIIALFSLGGFFIYLIFGFKVKRQRLFRDKHTKATNLKDMAKSQYREISAEVLRAGLLSDQKIVRLLLKSGLAPLSKRNSIEVLTDGMEKFSTLIEALKNASNHIHIEYYIYKEDKIGREIQQVLISKAKEGVAVRLLVDGWGSKDLSKSFMKQMRNAGIEAFFFLPIRFPFLSRKLNFRNHRKIVVIDGKIGFIGGLNIGDEYLSNDNDFGFWRDTHLVIKGEAVQTIQATFVNDWHFTTKQVIDGHNYYPEISNDQLSEAIPIQIIASGPDSECESMKLTFFSLLNRAQNKIYLETPYFIPDDNMVTALKAAAMSGVEVKIIVQGIPEYKILYWASRSYFEDLMKAGVQIYTYQKGILHCKILIIDNELGFVGSANFDVRSFILNFEISALVYNKEFVKRLEKDFMEDQFNSKELNLSQFYNRPIIERLKEANARLLEPLL